MTRTLYLISQILISKNVIPSPAESHAILSITMTYNVEPPLSNLPIPQIPTLHPLSQADHTMAVATEPLTPSNHLPLEPTGLTPSGFGNTPGFFSAEFGNLNPFDVDFQDATASPLRVEQPIGSPQAGGQGHYSTYPNDIPRSVADVAMRRNYDPSLVPTPGPRLPSLTTFRSSRLKESTPGQESTGSRLPPSPDRSPNVLNPAFLVEKGSSSSEYPASFTLPPPAQSGYGSSRGVHGQVTPPTDESRSPEDKDTSSKGRATASKQKPSSSKKRKSEPEFDIKSERDPSQTHSIDSPDSGYNMSPSASGPQSDNKRKKFLERNRLAASKCRQKKKEWANNLEEQARYQAQENKLLRASVAQLRDECLYLKNFLLSTHSGCQCVGVKNYLMKEAQFSQQVAGMGGVIPIANLVHHPGMDSRGYPIMGQMHHHMQQNQHDDRRRSQSVTSGMTMSQGSMSPQQ